MAVWNKVKTKVVVYLGDSRSIKVEGWMIWAITFLENKTSTSWLFASGLNAIFH